MLHCARMVVLGLGILAVATTVFQIFIVKNLYASIEMRKCIARRDRYSATIRDARIYPRTIDEIVEDFRGTQCAVTDGDILHVNRTVQNHMLARCRFLLEPRNAEHFCDANTFLVVFIMSSPGDFEIRRTVRETWAHPSNLFHPNLVAALPERFRTAFNNSAVRGKFAVRTLFVLGAEERIASLNEATFVDGRPETYGKAMDRRTTALRQLSVAARLRIAARRRESSATLQIEHGLQPAEMEATELEEAVRAESAQYGDILQAAFVDSYANLTLKVLLAAKWIAARCASARFAMKIDTDTVPNLPALVASLIERDLLESEAAALDFPSFYSTESNANDSVVLRYLAAFRNVTAAAAKNAGRNSQPCFRASSFADLSNSQDERVASTSSHSEAHQYPDLNAPSALARQTDVNVAENSNASARQTYSSHRTRGVRLVFSHQYSNAQGSSSLSNATVETQSISHANPVQNLSSAMQSFPVRCTSSRESLFYSHYYSPVMIGYRYGVSAVRRYGRWAVSHETYPFDTYPDYFSGTAYVLSTVAVHEVYHLALHYRYFFGIEDAFVTGVLGSVMRARKLDDSRFSPYNSRKPSVCQLLRGERITATNFQLDELITFWKELTSTHEC